MSSPPPSRSLFRNTSIMALGSIVSRVAGVAKIIAFASVLGQTGEFPDAYNLANTIPNIVYELIVGGILSASLVPVFVQHFTRSGEDEGWHAVSAVFTVTAVVLGALGAALFIAAPWIIDLYTVLRRDEAAADQREVATYLLRLFMPQVILYGFITLATGLLHARRRFGAPMFAPFFNNLVVVCVFLALGALYQDVSVEGMKQNKSVLIFLGLGTTAGVASMALWLVPFLGRAGAWRHLSWRFEPRHDAVRTVVRLSGWAAGLTIANQVSMAVLLALSYRSGNGDLTVFQFALIFFILPHGIIAVSFISALQPDWATSWGKHDIAAFRQSIAKGLRVLLFLMVPVAVGYAVLAEPLVVAILVRGQYELSNAAELSSVVAAMVVGLPALSVFVYLVRAFQSMPDGRTVFFLYLLQNVVLVAVAIPLYAAFRVQGLGLAQSLSYGVGALAALVILRRRIGGVEGRRLASTLIRVMGSTAIMGVIVWGVISALPVTVYLGLPAAILAGGALYLALAGILRMEEAHAVLRRNPFTGSSRKS